MHAVTDPVVTAQAVMGRAEALLADVRQARIALAAAPGSPERKPHCQAPQR
jgi:hypothetical protein